MGLREDRRRAATLLQQKYDKQDGDRRSLLANVDKRDRDEKQSKETEKAKLVDQNKAAVKPDPTVIALQKKIAVQDEQIKRLREEIGQFVNKKMDIEVKAGEVEVNMPEPPSSLTIEFEDGRTATVTPNYGE